MQKSNNESNKESNKESNNEEIEEETLEEYIQPPVKKGKGNHGPMSEVRLHNLSLAREKAAQLRKQINEAKPVPLKKEKKPSKLEIKLEKLKMEETKTEIDIEEEKEEEKEKEKEPIEEPIVDLHKTIRPKPKPVEKIEPAEIVQPIVPKPVEILAEPVLKKEPSIRKIGKFYYI
jgi:hypothetical protein